MEDEEFNYQINRIKALEERWNTVLGMHAWRINVEWDRERGNKEDDYGDGKNVTASVHYRWEYQWAVVRWYIPSVATWGDRDLERIFLHEMMHLKLALLGVKHADKWKEERVCTELADSLLWTREAVLEESKKDYAYEG